MLTTRHQLVSTLLTLLLFGHGSSTKREVFIPVLVPMYGTENDRYGFATAMNFAFEMINNRSDILPDYHLSPEFFDTVGSGSYALYLVMEIMDVNRCSSKKIPPIVLGPGFSTTTISTGQALSLLFTVQVAYGATSPVLANHYTYPFVVRAIPPTRSINEGNLGLMKRFGWKRVGIIFDHQAHDGIFNRNAEDLIGQIKSNNFTVVGVESLDAGPSPIATADDQILARLEKLKAADIKIFFAQFGYIQAYRIFCQVYKLSLYGRNYVWIAHPSVESPKDWLTVPTRYPHLKTECTEDEYQQVAARMLSSKQLQLRQDGKQTISGLTAKDYEQYVSDNRAKKHQDVMFHNSTSNAYSFDAVWATAMALNSSVEELKSINSSLDNMLWRNRKQALIIRRHLLNVTFEGITGPFAFDRAHLDRLGSLSVRQFRDNTFVLLGTYDTVTKTLELSDEKSREMWIDGKVPLDISLRRTVLLNIPLELYILVCTVAGLGIIVAIGVLIFNVYHRNQRYIRKSAPMFNNIIIFGIMVCLSSVAFFGLQVDLGDTEKFLKSCKLRSWFLCVGFSLSYGAMFVKTWRVYKIFTNRKLKYSIDRLSNKSLFIMVMSIVTIDVFILSLWELIDPLMVKTTTFDKKVDPEDSNTVLVPVVYSCFSIHQSKWITAIYSLKAILLLYGLFLAYETRNVQFEHLNDSRMIGVCVYNVAVMSILGGLLRIILSDAYYKENFGITSVSIIFPSLGTLFLIFLPKVVRFVKDGNGNVETQTADGVVIEGMGTRNGIDYQFRKDSVCSDGITTVSTSSLPCSNSRVMPLYEEAVSPATERHGESPTDDDRQVSSSA